MSDAGAAVVRAGGVSLRYGAVAALDDVTLALPAGCRVGLIGPDGVGKSSLLALVAGARRMQAGRLEVLGGDIADAAHRRRAGPRIAYMPQGLGRNLYPTLSVAENLQFFGRLFGHDAGERGRRIAELTAATGLAPFVDRPAGQLSGGMKQKLALCCALIHDPDLLILDEPTTGVDPLSRAQFWDLIDALRAGRPQMSVLVATAYMEEAERFDTLVAMDAGRVLATGTPAELRARTGAATLEAAFIALLPAERRRGHRAVVVPPLAADADVEVAIEARGLTMRFGRFTAVDDVSFRIRRGEIFGFLGSNGCGKSTTMKMLTGLLPASAGEARLFGREVDAGDLATRRRVGYMSQSFSLYGELSVVQNLALHARLFALPEDAVDARCAEMLERFGLGAVRDALPEQLPLGMRQRLSLAVAMVHRPELLILDEPTSGVDPIARDAFWELLVELARRDRVTIFISTHFMNEAERCDRISLMHAGRVLVSGSPQALRAQRGSATLEQAFIAWLREAGGDAPAAAGTGASATGTAPGTGTGAGTASATTAPATAADGSPSAGSGGSERSGPPGPSRRGAPGAAASRFSPRRLLSYSLREALELARDPVRATLALLGTAILMFIVGYGISLDVEDLPFAVLDGDDTVLSHDLALQFAGSRYFVERPPLASPAEADRRMRAGEIALAIEIPPGFERRLLRGQTPALGVWIDGAMPTRAETVRGYVEALHRQWLATQARERFGVALAAPAGVELRYRYNPDVRSLPAMVPAVIPLLLLMIPAMLAALSVVREKELGAIVNLYVTPVTRLEFLLGKQLPYVVLSMANFVAMCALAVTVFGVPMAGSFGSLAAAALLFALIATGFGLLASTFTRTQIAAMFVTIIGTVLPAVQFSGLIHPVGSLEGFGRAIGAVYPATHFLTISRGIFAKGLAAGDFVAEYRALAVTVPIVLGLAWALLPEQER